MNLTANIGTFLEELTWVEAEGVLNADTVVIIPLGAAAKEHGPHLKLKNDWLIAEYLKKAVAARAKVVVAPTVGFSFYPAFVDYPGSLSLSLETASNLILEICTSLAHFGPRRFYVINTGVSTTKVLNSVSDRLARNGVLMWYTNFQEAINQTVLEIGEQEGGGHADEIETSMMLYIAPKSVDMSKAVKDFDKDGNGKLSRIPVAGLTHSPSGIWGDATLANVSKGERVVKSLLAHILFAIEGLRTAPLPLAETIE